MRLLSDGEVGRDAVQAGWIDIGRRLQGLDDAYAFPAWAHPIVTRRCAGSIRHNQRRCALAAALAAESQLPPDHPPAGDPEGLHAAIRSLPPDQRATIALHHFERLSVAEVAVALAFPVGRVKTRLFHARRKLRAILDGDDT